MLRRVLLITKQRIKTLKRPYYRAFLFKYLFIKYNQTNKRSA